MISLYHPGSSPLHRLPAGAKLLGLLVLALALSLYPHGAVSILVTGALVVAAYLIGGFGPRMLARQIWLVKWLVLIMVVTQVILMTPALAGINTARVVSIILFAALVTLTTRSEDLLAALEVALTPLRPLGVDPRRIGLTLSLAISMIPVVAGIAAQVRDAQRARGVRLGYRAIVPLLVLALRHADDVGDALTARGFE